MLCNDFIGQVPELQELQVAWVDYWDTASCHWAALLETFRKGGDWQILKQAGRDD